MSDYDVPEPETSSLRDKLRERREKARETLFLDRPVPRLDDYVVRFKPLAGGRLESINKRAEKSRDEERYVIGSATSLAECCIGIFEVVTDEAKATTSTQDGRVLLAPIDPSKDEVRFDSTLAEILGMPETSQAVRVVRAFYLTDGDVVSESNALTAWSGYAGADEAEKYAGN